MSKTKMGRPSIFRDKEGGQRVQALISKRGGKQFELARRCLAVLAKREPKHVSDADVVEYLARGEEETRLYIEANQW